MFKYILKESDIPSDLEEYFDHDDIMFYGYGDKFDSAMLERGFFDHGIIRRSHRVITDKFKSLTLEEIKNSLLGLNTIGMPEEIIKSNYKRLMEINNNSEIDMILYVINEKKANLKSNVEAYDSGYKNALTELLAEIEKLKEERNNN